MIYWINFTFPGMDEKYSFLEEKVDANNPDEALIIFQDKLSANTNMDVDKIVNMKILYCGPDRFSLENRIH